MKYDVSLMTVESIDQFGPYPFSKGTEVLKLRKGDEVSVTWIPLFSITGRQIRETATVLSDDEIAKSKTTYSNGRRGTHESTKIVKGKKINRVRIGPRQPHRELYQKGDGTTGTFIDFTAPLKLRLNP